MLIGCLYTVLEMNGNIRTGTSQIQGSRHIVLVMYNICTVLTVLDDYIHIKNKPMSFWFDTINLG